MYAIVTSGGKQYKVEKDQIVKVEKLDANVGDKVELPVVMLCDEGNVVIGADAAKASVVAEVVAQDKAKKIIVFKYKPKKDYKKTQGHRQPYTKIEIVSVK